MGKRSDFIYAVPISEPFIPLRQPSLTMPQNRPHIVYAVRHEGLATVFASQVLDRMRVVAEHGLPVDVLVLSPLGQFLRKRLSQRWRDSIAGAITNGNFRIRRLPTMPSRLKSASIDRLILGHAIRRLVSSIAHMQIVLVGRNAVTTNLLLDSRKIRNVSLPVVYDCRGIEHVEAQYVACSQTEDVIAESAALERLIARAVRDSDRVLCVSHAMKTYLEQHFQLDPAKVLVIPCCVDVSQFKDSESERTSRRRELGLEQEFVVVYCGGLQKWQCVQESLALFQAILGLEAKAYFLAITPSAVGMEGMLASVGIPRERVKVLSLRHSEVPKYLPAGDIGLLLREKSDVNRVASPVKFGEYLAAGTPVLISPDVGDYSELVAKEGIGVVLEEASDSQSAARQVIRFVEQYRERREQIRQRCADVARTLLNFNTYLPTFEDMLRGCVKTY